MKKLNIFFCYFVHCLGGNNKHFVNIGEATEEIFTKLFKNNEGSETKNIISWYCNEANSGFRSKSALEIMYDNAYKEFIEYFEEKFVKNLKNDEEKYNKFEGVECNIYLSFIGHSIGGNVSRGLISILYSPFTKDGQTFENYFDYIINKYPFISNILPCSYIAISSPHLGSLVTATKEPNSTFSKVSEKFVVKNFTNIVVGDVGKNLTFKDEKVKKTNVSKKLNSTSEPISKYALINDCSKKAMADLGRFPNRTLTAHLRNDVQVKYCSAMGCIETPFPFLYQHEKERLVNDNENNVRIVMYSGFGEGSELEFYKKEIFNEEISPDLYFNNTTKYVPDIDIDEQIKNALINKNLLSQEKENIPTNYEEMEDVFVTDNDSQQDIPVALIKKFNQISFRRVSLDLLLPLHRRLYTHGLDLGFPKDSFFKPNAYMGIIIKKTVPFYAHLLIADYIKSSEQSNTYSLNDLIKH